jgi:hypothetical protein
MKRLVRLKVVVLFFLLLLPTLQIHAQADPPIITVDNAALLNDPIVAADARKASDVAWLDNDRMIGVFENALVIIDAETGDLEILGEQQPGTRLREIEVMGQTIAYTYCFNQVNNICQNNGIFVEGPMFTGNIVTGTERIKAFNLINNGESAIIRGQTGFAQSRASVWSTQAEYEPLLEFDIDTAYVSPDGTLILVHESFESWRNNTFRAYDTTTLDAISDELSFDVWVSGDVAMSHDNTKLATLYCPGENGCNGDGRAIVVLSIETGEILTELDFSDADDPKGFVDAIGFSPDDSLLVALMCLEVSDCTDPIMYLIDVASGEIIDSRQIAHQDDENIRVYFNPAGTRLTVMTTVCGPDDCGAQILIFTTEDIE